MPKIKRHEDFWAGVLFLAIGLTALVMAFDYSIGTTRVMGPGYFPFGLGIILSVLGLAQIIISFSGAVVAAPKIALWPLLVVLAGSASFGLLLRSAGLLIAVLSVVLIGALASPRSRPGSAMLLAIGLAIGSGLVFAHWLGQPLPIVGHWFAGS